MQRLAECDGCIMSAVPTLNLPSQMAQPKEGGEEWQAADQEDDDEEEWEEA